MAAKDNSEMTVSSYLFFLEYGEILGSTLEGCPDDLRKQTFRYYATGRVKTFNDTQPFVLDETIQENLKIRVYANSGVGNLWVLRFPLDSKEPEDKGNYDLVSDSLSLLRDGQVNGFKLKMPLQNLIKYNIFDLIKR